MYLKGLKIVVFLKRSKFFYWLDFVKKTVKL
jgi:hypothetical protein